MLGWTRDEMAAFYAGLPEIVSATPGQVEAAFRGQWGGNWRDGLAFARARRPGAAADRLLDLGMNDAMFGGSAVAFAEHLAQRQPPWLYRFDWAAPANPFGACHCIDLPFAFNTVDRWQAPMLRGADADELARLARVVHRTWAAFVRCGDPAHADLPAWPRYDRARRWTLRFDTVTETAGDLAGVGLPGRPWPASLPLP
jgi:para-nitrobenzyl esterase